MTPQQFKEWVGPVSQLVAALAAIVLAVLWIVSIQSRLDRIEDSPARETCAALATSYAHESSQHNSLDSAAAAEIKELMSEVGCMRKTSR